MVQGGECSAKDKTDVDALLRFAMSLPVTTAETKMNFAAMYGIARSRFARAKPTIAGSVRQFALLLVAFGAIALTRWLAFCRGIDKDDCRRLQPYVDNHTLAGAVDPGGVARQSAEPGGGGLLGHRRQDDR